MALTDRQKYLIDLLHDMEFEADEILELISKLEDKENLEGVLKRIEAYKCSSSLSSPSPVNLGSFQSNTLPSSESYLVKL